MKTHSKYREISFSIPEARINFFVNFHVWGQPRVSPMRCSPYDCVMYICVHGYRLLATSWEEMYVGLPTWINHVVHTERVKWEICVQYLSCLPSEFPGSDSTIDQITDELNKPGRHYVNTRGYVNTYIVYYSRNNLVKFSERNHYSLIPMRIEFLLI